MPKLITNWKELIGLESENYKLKVELMKYDMGCAWIIPKNEVEEGRIKSDEEHIYLSTRTFYKDQYKIATNILQKHGFDVELVEEKILYQSHED